MGPFQVILRGAGAILGDLKGQGTMVGYFEGSGDHFWGILREAGTIFGYIGPF